MYAILPVIPLMCSGSEPPVWGVELDIATVVAYVNVTNRLAAGSEYG